jgi:Predicted flavin-nucleotide-binding protein
MKISLMRHNTNVCFEVDFINKTENWQSVICWGSFEEIVNPVEREEVLKKLHSSALPKVVSLTARLSPSWPLLPRDFDSIEGVVFRIKLYKKTGKFQNSS